MTTVMAKARLREGEPEMPPRDSIKRVTTFTRAGDPATQSDGRTLDGYAAVFRQETLIDSWEGRFFESLAPGSTKKTLSETVPRLQFDHGTHPMIGSIPIGHVTSAREQKDPLLAPDGGVHVVARIFDNWLTAPVRDAISEGAIDGMSFRFSVVREEWRTAGGDLIEDPQALQDALFRTWLEDVPETELLHRTLREVRIRELGPVVWPAYEGTSVGLRSTSVTIDLGAVRSGDPEERRKLAEALFVADVAPSVERFSSHRGGARRYAGGDGGPRTAGSHPRCGRRPRRGHVRRAGSHRHGR